MFSQTLVQGLNSLPDRPWREKRGGKGITVAWLAEQLQSYGIRPVPMRIGQVQARGYWEDDFQEAFQRYMSRSDMEALRASLQARQRADPPSSDSGATSPPSPSDSGAATDGEKKKDEPGKTQGGEAEAA